MYILFALLRCLLTSLMSLSPLDRCFWFLWVLFKCCTMFILTHTTVLSNGINYGLFSFWTIEYPDDFDLAMTLISTCFPHCQRAVFRPFAAERLPPQIDFRPYQIPILMSLTIHRHTVCRQLEAKVIVLHPAIDHAPIPIIFYSFSSRRLLGPIPADRSSNSRHQYHLWDRCYRIYQPGPSPDPTGLRLSSPRV